MKRIAGAVLSVLVTVLFFSGCAGNSPPEETKIRAQLAGEWVSWLGGEDDESLVYIFTETEVRSQHFSSGALIWQQDGTYSVSEMEFDRGSWRGTVTAELGDESCRVPFRTDRDGNSLALGVSGDINSPGFFKRKTGPC